MIAATLRKALLLPLAVLTAAVLAPTTSAQPTEPAFRGDDPAALADLALARASLSTATARFDPALLPLFRSGEFTTPLYSALAQDPWLTPAFANARRRELLANATKPNEILNYGAAMAGFGTKRALLSNPIAYADPKRLGSLDGELKTIRASGLLAGPAPSTAGVPAPVRDAAAILIEVARRAVEMRRLALGGISDPKKLFARLALGKLDEGNLTQSSEVTNAYRSIQPVYFAAAGHDLALAVQQAKALCQTVPRTERYSWRVRTDWGMIRLSGGGDTTYPDEPSFITIDTGGNDTYLNAPSTTSAANWVSLLIDTDGNDVYLSDPALAQSSIGAFKNRKGGDRPGPAGAAMGVAILWDTDGNDLYRSHRPGLASARVGAALLVDEEGDDAYEGYADAEGFASFGTSALIDLAGNDRYYGFNQVQGVGLTGGTGILLDVKGADKYVAEDTIIDIPSPQDPKHQVSMAQGAGNGRRADYIDGLSYAGGVGILADGEGNDTYDCGVFGQGVGYWEGVGMLLEGGGDDVYRGNWYVQGAGAHYSIGFLDDVSGDDRYSVAQSMGQGAGHDFSMGGLVDRSGDDRYEGANLSQGAGNANGMGYLLDLRGNDHYKATGTSQGRATPGTANSMREIAFSLGLLADGGGRDTYEGTDARGDGAPRTSPATLPDNPARSQLGLFWDR